MKQGFELQEKPNGYTWHQLKPQRMITYLPNVNLYSMVFWARWCMTIGKAITILRALSMAYVINIIYVN